MDPSTSKLSVGDVLDKIGMTPHHWRVVTLTWWIFFLSGWVYALTPYLLDAAGGRHSDWIERTSTSYRMDDSAKSMAMLFAGVAGLLGNPIMGHMADRYGRIFTIIAALSLVSISTVGFALSSSWKMLIACMCLAPFGRDGTNPIAQSVLAEWVPIAYRGRLIVGAHVLFNVGRLTLTIFWLFFSPRDNWVAFFLASSVFPICTSLFLMLFGLRYESPRWLALAGKMSSLKMTLGYAVSSVDRVERIGEDWYDPVNLRLDGHRGRSAVDGPIPTPSAFESVGMTGMRSTICFFGICYFCVSYSSWGMFTWSIDFLKAIGAGDAVNTVLIASPLAKIFAGMILVCPWFGKSPVDRFGRLQIFRIGIFGFGLFLIAIYYCGTNSVLITLATFLALMCEEWVWSVGTTCITESFPTSLRNVAFSYIMIYVSAGGIVANSISLGLLRQWRYLPIAVMSSLLLLAFGTSFALPEDRKDKPLIDTCKKQEESSYSTMAA